MKSYQFYLVLLIGFCLASCNAPTRDISPNEYDNMKLGGSIIIQIVDTNNNLKTYTGHAADFGLIYFNGGAERNNNKPKFSLPRKSNDSDYGSRPLELSLRNTNLGDTNFLFHFYHDDFSDYYYSNRNFKHIVKQDTLYRLVDMNSINLDIQFPGFKFWSNRNNFDSTSSLWISNLKEKNQPTEFVIYLKAPIYDYRDSLVPYKSISIRVNTFLIP